MNVKFETVKLFFKNVLSLFFLENKKKNENSCTSMSGIERAIVYNICIVHKYTLQKSIKIS